MDGKRTKEGNVKLVLPTVGITEVQVKQTMTRVGSTQWRCSIILW
jgi:hypothetical protein